MSVPKLHQNEFDISAALVARLIAAQFPAWAHLPLRRVTSPGTVHAMYRLGQDMVVRLPRIGVALEEVEKEYLWLPRLARHLPVQISAPIARGAPTSEYPSLWSVYSWLEGENPVPGQLADSVPLALDLAAFITALRGLDSVAGLNSVNAPSSERGRRTLRSLDAQARASLQESAELIDAEAARRAWEAALNAPEWSGPHVWVHADLSPGNLLVRHGRLSGVIDWGSLGTGDPASDLSVAWSLLPAGARATFRQALNADDATWNRARGLALVIALAALPYYQHTNPAFAEIARFTITQVLADHKLEDF